MSHLVRQRIKYLVEFGELYPDGEGATKNFMVKLAGVIVLAELVGVAVHIWLTVR